MTAGTAAFRRMPLPWYMVCLVTLSALVLASAETAWACVPQPFVVIEPAAYGVPGTQVTVHGLLFSGRVEVRWNAIDGPRLAMASGEEFSVPITIPPADPGLYNILVVIRAPDGAVTVGGRASFLVPVMLGSTSTGPAPAAKGVVSQAKSSSGHPLAQAVAADIGVLVVGGLGGAWLVGRRRRASEQTEEAAATGQEV